MEQNNVTKMVDELIAKRSIQEAFETFNEKNPDVYNHFIRLALAAVRKGKRRISANMIINVIRWDIFMKTTDDTLFTKAGTEISFKINDHYSSRYARLFIRDYPQFADRIDMREIRSK